MLLTFRKRAVLALATLLPLAAAPLLAAAPAAGAAVADSTVAITDPTADAMRAGAKVDEPRADIVAASVRNQNGFVTLTMKLAKGDDLSGATANDYLR